MRRTSTGLLLAAVCLMGCGDDDKTPNLAPHHTADFRSGACPITPPDGETVECGVVTVPARRDGTAGDRKIRLRIAILKSHAVQPAEEPIVYLSGGPGQSAIESVLPDPGPFGALLASRHLVLLDQRGTGFSTPPMNCPSAGTVEECRSDVVKAGADPADYTTEESAQDVRDVRIALGYAKWVVFGISYGTRLALTTMKYDQDGTASVIIDSVVPPQVDSYAQEGPNAERAFDMLFDGCAAQPSCAAAYPDLRSAFFGAVTSLNETPANVTLSDGTSRPLTGSLLVQLMFMVMYSAEVLPELPRVIWEVHTHDYSTMGRLMSAVSGGQSDMSIGMYLSVRCGEDVAYTTRDAVNAAAATMTEPELRKEFGGTELFDQCAVWNVPPADPATRNPVTSPLATLVLEGSNDPVTPPPYGELAASTLPNSFYFELPGQSHGVFSSPCGTALIAAFLSDPAKQPAPGCLASTGPVVFTTPSGTMQTLSAAPAPPALDDETARRIVDRARRSGHGRTVVDRIARRMRDM